MSMILVTNIDSSPQNLGFLAFLTKIVVTTFRLSL